MVTEWSMGTVFQWMFSTLTGTLSKQSIKRHLKHLRHLVCVCGRISIILPSDYYYNLRIIRIQKDISDCRGGRVSRWRERRFQPCCLILENKVFVHPNLSLKQLLHVCQGTGAFRERIERGEGRHLGLNQGNQS